MTEPRSLNPLEGDFLDKGRPEWSGRSLPLSASPDAFPRDSSRWWLSRLLRKMTVRNVRLQMLRDYYRGENETWSLADRAHRDTFGRRFMNLRANLALPVVEVVEQRMSVIGMEIPGDDAGSETAWEMWGQNGLDARSSDAFLELLSTGICPVMVDPWREVAPGIPLITVEDPLGVIVEPDPADGRSRRAAMKQWTEDDGRRVAILYLPDRIEWWRTLDTVEPDRSPRWRSVEGEGGPNPLGVVPVVELRNAPRARAEHEGIIDQLKQIAAALYRMATAAHYTSYRQKWATGVEEEEEGVETDAAGDPLRSRPASAESGPDTIATSPNDLARFGNFEQSDMVPFIREIEMHQALIGTISSMPHRLLLSPPSSVPRSGEAVRLEDLPLTQKIERKFTTVGNGLEAVMRLAFLARGDQFRARRMDMETWWKDPQPYTLSELMDALTKAQAIGIPGEELWRRYGATPAQIRSWKKPPAPRQEPPRSEDQPPESIRRLAG